jgi:hypothetical protein
MWKVNRQQTPNDGKSSWQGELKTTVNMKVSGFCYDLIWFIVLNTSFSNISAISWRPVLVVEEAGVPGENHQPWASNW